MNRILFNADAIVLSCNFNTVNIYTDRAFADVTLTSSMGVKLICERFYPNDAGRIELTDLRSVVEDMFDRAGDNPLDTFRITVAQLGEDEPDEVSLDITVLCCKAHTDVDDASEFLRNNFLTVGKSRRIGPNGTFSLAYITESKVNIGYNIICRYINEWGNCYARSLSSDNMNTYSTNEPQVQRIFGSVSDIARRLNEKMGTEVQLVSFTIKSVASPRAVTYFIDQSMTAPLSFMFVNIFNAIDVLEFRGVTTAKSKVERKQADVSGKARHYNLTPSKEFEVQSAGLTADECLLAEQMFVSPDVRMPIGRYADESDFFANRPILITDSTCEVSDSGESVNSVKFTWRYPAKMPFVGLDTPDGIFTEPFDFRFT